MDLNIRTNSIHVVSLMCASLHGYLKTVYMCLYVCVFLCYILSHCVIYYYTIVVLSLTYWCYSYSYVWVWWYMLCRILYSCFI